MSVPVTSLGSGGPGPASAGGNPKLAAVAIVVACLLQVVVLLFTFLMGLGWGGVTWLVALAQAAGALALILRLGAQRKLALALLVPLLSACVTAALAAAGHARAVATACSQEELAAAEELSPPPGSEVALSGTSTQDCIARADTTLSSQEVIQHYRGQFRQHGWLENPQLQPGSVGVAAVKQGIAYTVSIEGRHGEGIPPVQVVVGSRAGSSGTCVAEPPVVEPGQHVVVLLTEGGPATVALRNAGGEVLLEGEAAGPEQDPPVVALGEGQYVVECRPADGPVLTEPLRVAWSDSGESENGQSLFVSVFEIGVGESS